jgi:RNA polymerase sigma-70 factor, ECF subfamily
METSAPQTAAIWSEFAAPLRAFVARRAPGGAEPDDVLQDVFLRIQEQLPNLRDAERIDAWIFQIARNVLADLFRGRGRQDALRERSANEPAAGGDDDDERTATAALASCLTSMITKLPEPYREAIMLTELCGMSQVEAARHVGISISGMKSRVQRGREQLKTIIGGSCRVELDVRGGVVECDPRRGGGGCGERLRPPACGRDSMGMTNTIETNETETTTSTTSPAATGCCGGAAPKDSGACCALDAEVKQSGGTGCGCSSKAASAPAPAKKGCC